MDVLDSASCTHNVPNISTPVPRGPSPLYPAICHGPPSAARILHPLSVILYPSSTIGRQPDAPRIYRGPITCRAGRTRRESQTGAKIAAPEGRARRHRRRYWRAESAGYAASTPFTRTQSAGVQYTTSPVATPRRRQ